MRAENFSPGAGDVIADNWFPFSPYDGLAGSIYGEGGGLGARASVPSVGRPFGGLEPSPHVAKIGRDTEPGQYRRR